MNRAKRSSKCFDSDITPLPPLSKNSKQKQIFSSDGFPLAEAIAMAMAMAMATASSLL
jgi:hypothetical protein